MIVKMKGKYHLVINTLILFILFGLFISQSSSDIPISASLFFSCSFLFIIGSLLPDSDSNNKGSMIYVLVPIAIKKMTRGGRRKKMNVYEEIGKMILLIFGIILYPMGLITNQLEELAMKYTERKRGHRQSLHTVSGILIVSIFWSIIFYIIYSSLIGSYSLLVLPLFLVTLFISQLLHLIEDLTYPGWSIRWK